MKRILFSFLLVLASLSVVLSQTTTGRLSGTVSTTDGVVPGATVTATDTATGKEQTTTTNDSGEYVFPQLEFGTYTVKINATGFKSFVANEVKVDVGREYTLDRQLEVGNVQETVTVTAGTDVVTANTAQISNTVSPQQILSLPLITRNPLSLTTLQPGVASNSANATVINGMRTTFTNITRDGINIQDAFIRTNATDFAPGRPSVDDTGEFTITTTNQEADQGYGGAQIRLVTPRGTKDFHGALFAYNRNSEFAANSFFRNRSNIARPFRNRNQYGGKLSGPLWVPGFNEGGPMLYKDKSFFFFAYERISDPQSTTVNGGRTILTPSARAGTFQFNRAFAGNPINNVNGLSCPSGAVNSVCTVTNILTFARSFGGSLGTVPANISPLITSRILSQLPTAGNTTGGDGFNTAGYLLSRQNTQKRDQYSSRVDVDFTEKDSFLGIFNYNKESNLRPDADINKFTEVPGVIQYSTNIQFTAAYRRIISTNFVNEFRVGVFTSEVPFDRTDEIPNYFIAPTLITFPENLFLSQGRNTKSFNVQDNADYVWGKHTFKFGGQAQIFRVNSYNDAAIVPVINLGAGAGTPSFAAATNFANSCTPSPCPSTQLSVINANQLATANGLLALLGGLFNSATQSFNVNDVGRGFQVERQFTPFRYENYSAYFFDRWAVTNELTLALGVRYELFPALRLNNGVALEPVITDIDNPLPELLSPNGTYNVIGGNAGRKNAYYKTDMNNFAPNIGVAWSPSFDEGVLGFLFGQNKTVIRGGYSQIYGNDSIVTSINNAAVGNVGFGRTPSNPINLNGQIDGTIPTVNPPAFIVPPRSYLQNNAIANFFGTVFAVDPKLETPMIQQYNVGIQREFFGNTAVEVRYVGTRSNNLARGVDLNQIDIFNTGFLADFQRAQANARLTGDPFCVAAGCQALTIFQQTPGAPGRLGVAPTTAATPVGTIARNTFLNALANGTPADLALSFINSAGNLNNQPSSLNPTAVPRLNFLANPGTGVVDYFLNDGKYDYNSFQIEVRRRFANGVYFQANYTFSKNLTNAVGTTQQLFEPFLDNNNKDLDYQRADYDQTHVFSFNGIFQLPIGQGKMFLNKGGLMDKIFGGFELSGLMQWTSGAPITFVDTRGTFNRTGRSARQTPTSNLTNDQIRALSGVFHLNGAVYFINPSVLNTTYNPVTGAITSVASNGYNTTPFEGQAFFNVEAGQTGNVGRALIDGPNYLNVNMALLKNIRFTETMRLQLRMEAFNVFNTTQFIQNTQFANINSTSFGQITSTFDPRQIQFAARFEF